MPCDCIGPMAMNVRPKGGRRGGSNGDHCRVRWARPAAAAVRSGSAARRRNARVVSPLEGEARKRAGAVLPSPLFRSCTGGTTTVPTEPGSPLARHLCRQSRRDRGRQGALKWGLWLPAAAACATRMRGRDGRTTTTTSTSTGPSPQRARRDGNATILPPPPPLKERGSREESRGHAVPRRPLRFPSGPRWRVEAREEEGGRCRPPPPRPPPGPRRAAGGALAPHRWWERRRRRRSEGRRQTRPERTRRTPPGLPPWRAAGPKSATTARTSFSWT